MTIGGANYCMFASWQVEELLLSGGHYLLCHLGLLLGRGNIWEYVIPSASLGSSMVHTTVGYNPTNLHSFVRCKGMVDGGD